MRRVLRDAARDITHELANGVRAGRLSRSDDVDTLVGRLAGEVMKLFDEEVGPGPGPDALDRRLSALEAKLEVLAGSESGEEDGDEADNGSSLPDLKYARPKYKDINGVGAGKLSRSDELGTLVSRLAGEVMKLIDREEAPGSGPYALDRRLEALEDKLEVLAGSESEEEDDDEADNGTSLPNLKYARPKYKDIQSMLKYVESDDDKGGVKLVIMNFND